MKEKNIVLYDGDCGFCNFWVQWILERDKKDMFRFASLQSKFGQDYLKSKNLNFVNFNTLYLIKSDSELLEKSDAVLEIAKSLGGIYSISRIFKMIPKFFRDKMYDLVAENRKELAGEKCLLPTPEQRKKFINN